MQAEAACTENLNNWLCDDFDNVPIVDSDANASVTITKSGILDIDVNQEKVAITLSAETGIFTVTNNGSIINDNYQAEGIFVSGSDGFVLTNENEIRAYSEAVKTDKVNFVAITNNGSITGKLHAIDIKDASTKVTIDNNGLISSHLHNGYGIKIDGVLNVDNVEFAAVITNQGIISSGTYGGHAIFAQNIQGGLLIDNAAKATIESPKTYSAIYVDDTENSASDRVQLLNAGSISTKGSFQHHIIHINNITDVELDNSGKITTSNGNGILIDNASGNVDMNNSGTVAIKYSGITFSNVGGDVAFTNSGEIASSSDNGVEINNVVGNVALNNSGSVSGNGGSREAIIIDNVDGNIGLINSGQVTGYDHGTLISNVGGNIDLLNTGEIVGEHVDGIKIHDVVGYVNFNNDDAVIVGDDNGVDIYGIAGPFYFINSGKVIGNNSNGVDIADINDNVDIVNNGAMVGGDVGILFVNVGGTINIDNSDGIEGTQQGISVFNVAGEFNLTNAGDITGYEKEAILITQSNNNTIYNELDSLIRTLNNENFAAINFDPNGTSEDVFINQGDVVGNVLLNAGTDTVHLLAGMSIEGEIHGGNGTDTLFFDEGANEIGEFDIDTLSGIEQGHIKDAKWHLSSEGNLSNMFNKFDLGEINPGDNELPWLVVSGSNDFNVFSLKTQTYQQFSNGTLSVAIDLAGTEADKLSISGNAILGGHLAIGLVNELDLKPKSEKSFIILEAGQIDEMDGPEFDSYSFDPDLYKDSLVITQEVEYNYDNLVENNNLDIVKVVFTRSDYDGDNLGIKYQPNDSAWGGYLTETLVNNAYSGNRGITAYLENIDMTADGEAYLDKFHAGSGQVNTVHNQTLLASSETMTDVINDRLYTRGETCAESDANCSEKQTQGWLDVRGGKTNRHSMDENSEIDLISITAGVDHAITNDVVMGAALAYHHSESDAYTNGSTSTGFGRLNAESQALGLDGYIQYTGMINTVPYYLRGMLGYQVTKIKGDRDIVIADTGSRSGLTAQFDQEADGHALRVGSEFGLQFKLKNFKVSPYVGLEHVSARMNDFEETSTSGHGDLALSVNFDDVNQTSLEGGVRLGAELMNVGSSTVSLHVQPYLRGIVSGDEPELSTHYAVTDSSYKANLKSHNDDLQMGISLGGDVTFGALSIGAGVDFTSSDTLNKTQGSLRARFAF